jgi:hypothetical protein
MLVGPLECFFCAGGYMVFSFIKTHGSAHVNQAHFIAYNFYLSNNDVKMVCEITLLPNLYLNIFLPVIFMLLRLDHFCGSVFKFTDSFFWGFFVVWGFEFRVLHLLGSHPPSHFGFSYFSDRPCIFCLDPALDLYSLPLLSL